MNDTIIFLTAATIYLTTLAAVLELMLEVSDKFSVSGKVGDETIYYMWGKED